MKKTEQINVHVTVDMRRRLEKVAGLEGVDLPELIRGWIREKLATYKVPKIFRGPKAEN